MLTFLTIIDLINKVLVSAIKLISFLQCFLEPRNISSQEDISIIVLLKLLNNL